MNTFLTRVEAAITALKQGKMIVLTDDSQRENEGDLIFPAEIINPAVINTMIRQGSGIVCLALTASRLQQLHIPLMVPSQDNFSTHTTAFTISIEARTGITTGVSAADRARTIQVAVDEQTKPDDLVKPGHVFPLQAKEGGVLARQGHTEGSIDIVRLAGFKPAAVICELMNPDGSMMQNQQLVEFASRHELTLLSIEDIGNYRLCHENIISEMASAQLPTTSFGTFEITVIKEKLTDREHMVLYQPSKSPSPLVRIHSSCFTGDLLGSLRCDCQQQLHYSLDRISKEGGMLIYLNQEGRGIGLLNKIKAYALQQQGIDTVEANHQLGLAADLRQYHIAAQILKRWHFNDIRLLTNNPYKLADLKKFGISTVIREPMPIFNNAHNHKYLRTKKTKLNHLFDLEAIL